MKNIFKLLIFLHMGVCFNAHAQVPGTPYIFARPTAAAPALPSSITCCVGATISVTPCDSISGTRINDNTATTGIEYDWSGAVGWLADNDTVRALIEFGGQCWYRYNSIAIPSNYNPSPTLFVGYNGSHTIPTAAATRPKIGRLYQWIAAMNGATTARSQGVCAPGFHIPSSCEAIYRVLNLSTSDYENITATSVSTDTVNDLSTIYLPAVGIPAPYTVETGFDMVWPAGSAWRLNQNPTSWSTSEVILTAFLVSEGGFPNHRIGVNNIRSGTPFGGPWAESNCSAALLGAWEYAYVRCVAD